MIVLCLFVGLKCAMKQTTLRVCFIAMKIKNGGATCHLKKKIDGLFSCLVVGGNESSYGG